MVLVSLSLSVLQVRADTLGRSPQNPSANPNREQRVSGFSLHPAAELSLTYDSNAFLNEDGQEEDDIYLDAVLALSGRLSSGRNALTLGGWYRFRRYDALERLDNEDYVVTADLIFGSDTLGLSDTWTIRPSISYGRTVDYTHDADELLLHDEDARMIRLGRPDREIQRRLTAGVDAGGPVTDKLDLNLGYGYRRIRYKRTDLLGDASHKLGGRAGLQVTDRSLVSLSADYSEHDNDSFEDDPRHYAIRLGYRQQRTDKITMEVALGYFAFRADDDRFLDRDGLSYWVTTRWRATPKLQFALTGENLSELAEDDPGNARLVSRLTATARHRLSNRVWGDVAVGYRYENYNRPSPPPVQDEPGAQRRADVPGGLRPFRDPDETFIDRKVEQFIYRAGLAFWFTNYSHLRATAQYEDTRDNVIGDYEQYRLTLAVRFAI